MWSKSHVMVLQDVSTYARGLNITPRDRNALLFSCAVNAGAHVLWSALLNGATLCLFDVRKQGLDSLPQWLAASEISLYASVPTLFRHCMEHLTQDLSFPKLRVILMVGEPLYASDVVLFKRLPAPRRVLVHRLGSTETGTILWCFVDGQELIPGTPALGLRPPGRTASRSGGAGPHVPVGLPPPGNEILLPARSAGR